jgi:hypothetical protein
MKISILSDNRMIIKILRSSQDGKINIFFGLIIAFNPFLLDRKAKSKYRHCGAS